MPLTDAERIAAAQAYISALASHRGDDVPFAPNCVRFELGWCPVHVNPEPWARLKEPLGPLFLENGPTRLECRFDCARCRMELVLRPAPGR